MQATDLPSCSAHTMLKGLLVFAVTYLLVSTRQLRFARLDRPAGAIVGAVLAVAVGAITPDDAAKAVDHTLTYPW